MLEWLAISAGGGFATQMFALSFALLFSTMIGFEREWNMKDAGLRTHALVGVASALIMIVSKYGFQDVLTDQIRSDPGRLAAQIVTGIGFIGGGLIFVHRDLVRGLTTAAAIWLTAAVGMACGAGMIVPALFVTITYFLVVIGYTAFAHRILLKQSNILITFEPNRDVVAQLIGTCASWGFVATFGNYETPAGELAQVCVSVSGRRDTDSLMITMRDLANVVEVELLSREPVRTSQIHG